MLSKAEQLRLGIAGVPNRYAAVSTACYHQIGVKRAIVDRHDLGDMSFDALRTHLLSIVPQFKFSVVTD